MEIIKRYHAEFVADAFRNISGIPCVRNGHDAYPDILHQLQSFLFVLFFASDT